MNKEKHLAKIFVEEYHHENELNDFIKLCIKLKASDLIDVNIELLEKEIRKLANL